MNTVKNLIFSHFGLTYNLLHPTRRHSFPPRGTNSLIQQLTTSVLSKPTSTAPWRNGILHSYFPGSWLCGECSYPAAGTQSATTAGKL